MKIKLILLVLFLSCLQGCSSKLAYNNADWLANWYIDDYLDLTLDQNQLLSLELESVLEWHRKTQLPKYKKRLLTISSDLNSLPMSEDTWLQHFNGITEFWNIARHEISLRSAKLAPLLNENQVEYLFIKLKEKNQKRLDEVNDQSIAEYREERFEKLEETVEDYLGSLTEKQRQAILDFTQNAKITELQWFNSKVDLQAAMKDAFKQETAETLTQQLFLLMDNPDQFKSESLLSAYEYNRQLLVMMLHKLTASLSAEQVDHFKNEINSLVQTIDEIR
jgi:hypothetical protein